MGTYKWKPFTLLVSAEEVEKEVLKIEAGKYYKTRDGRKVGPMRELDRNDTDWPWTDQDGDMPYQRYNDKGNGIGLRMEDCRHIISEWQDETPSPIRTVTRREIVPGNYGCVEIDVHAYGMSVVVDFSTVRHDAGELREAAHLLNQIAEVLGENGE